MNRMNNKKTLTANFVEYDENGEPYMFQYIISGDVTYICTEDGNPICILDEKSRINGQDLIRMVRRDETKN